MRRRPRSLRRETSSDKGKTENETSKLIIINLLKINK